MVDPHRLIVPTVALLGAAALAAAAAVALLPDAAIRWVPAIVGVLWTAAMTWFARRLRGDPTIGWKSVRSGAIACGLLTLVAFSVGLRQRIGWPELILVIPALIGLLVWARQTVREFRLRRRLPPAPPGPVLRLRDEARRPPRRPPWL